MQLYIYTKLVCYSRLLSFFFSYINRRRPLPLLWNVTPTISKFPKKSASPTHTTKHRLLIPGKNRPHLSPNCHQIQPAAYQLTMRSMDILSSRWLSNPSKQDISHVHCCWGPRMTFARTEWNAPLPRRVARLSWSLLHLYIRPWLRIYPS